MKNRECWTFSNSIQFFTNFPLCIEQWISPNLRWSTFPQINGSRGSLRPLQPSDLPIVVRDVQDFCILRLCFQLRIIFSDSVHLKISMDWCVKCRELAPYSGAFNEVDVPFLGQSNSCIPKIQTRSIFSCIVTISMQIKLGVSCRRPKNFPLHVLPFSFQYASSIWTYYKVSCPDIRIWYRLRINFLLYWVNSFIYSMYEYIFYTFNFKRHLLVWVLILLFTLWSLLVVSSVTVIIATPSIRVGVTVWSICVLSIPCV